MSEDDRAAKAARARALLKKRQQQKVASSSTAGDSRVASPSPPPSRSFTPALAETTPAPRVENDSKDVGTLFTNGHNVAPDTHWLSSLDRVDGPTPPLSTFRHHPSSAYPTPPPLLSPPASSPSISPRPPHAIAPLTHPDVGGQTDLRTLIQEQARAIASLEAEKVSLNVSVEQLKHADTKLQQMNDVLQSERSKTEKLQGFLEHAESDVEQLTNQLEEHNIRLASLESEKGSLSRQLAAAKTEAQKSRELFQGERNKVENLEEVIQRMEKDMSELDVRLEQKEKSISSLQFEKAALSACVERLKGSESKLLEAQSALKAERDKTAASQRRISELEASLQDLSSKLDQQQQTIALLVSEKSTLSASLERLKDADARLQETSDLLEAEKMKTEELQEAVQRLEAEGDESSERIAELSAAEKSFIDKSRDQERALHLLNSELTESKSRAEQYLRRARELEEQIETDDRAERLESILQNTQDRADDLEIQISNLKQASERNDLEARLQAQSHIETEWQKRHAESEKLYASIQEQLTSTATKRDNLLQEKSTLESQVYAAQTSLNELQHKLAQSTSELSTSVRSLQQAQSELRAANRRADEAEKIQADLQTEGIGLMRSLEEMRPKIVELTDVKLDLGEKVESLGRTLKDRDETVAQLEAKLEELREQQLAAQRKQQELSGALEKEISHSNESNSELQEAYADLQKELETTTANAQSLEGERSQYRHTASRHMDEISRLTASVQSHSEQVSSLQAELEERQRAQDEATEFLERAHSEMELLRAQLSAQDEELERHKEATVSLTVPGPHSFDEEMLNTLTQQHSLELSAARSEIRTLENSVFQAEAKAHSLQRQVAALEDQLAHLRPSSRNSQLPSVPARVSSRNFDHSDDLRRASFGSGRPTGVTRPASPPSSFEGLSAETRHKRKVSLSMLKARIDSETATAKSHPSSRAMSPAVKPTSLPTVVEPRSAPGTPPPQHLGRTSQFLDESHIFWCHSCRGDLVIL
ncbi:hypothetical protein PHLCEN_2v2865 [Hermanssonia centrifuga]|uniref:Uncharacterized protein n=1 Tax=Hermanssonia centrifuga TaxID=98765 RepID=A0A2R6RI75_9APHY|nr:hypothetical protein PHLCEN_2v2865 [Hermanssonia centrifuga]